MVEIPVIKITCGSTDCDNGRHAFNDPKHKYKRRGSGRNHLEPGVCKGCGASLVDWPRVHQRDIADISHTVESLKHEYIRHEYWSRPFNQTTLINAAREGRNEINARAVRELSSIVKPGKAAFSMTGVPTEDAKLKHMTQYGRHATATCCRRCVATWHGVPNERPLTDEQLKYCASLLLHFIDRRWPLRSDS